MAVYTFGTFTLNQNSAGLGYFLTAKELPMPTVKPVTFLIARRDGTKKSGESVDARTITVTIKIVGTSRTDLIIRLDALQQSLTLRSQTLCIHEDGRYYQSVDAISAPVSLSAGKGIVQCECVVVFTAYDPYAYASALSTFDTGTVALTLASSLWNFAAQVITGGGTVYSLPLIRLYNRTSTGSTTLTVARNSGTNYTTIVVASTPFSGSIGDTIIITHAGTSQTLTVNANFSVGATTITVVSFTAGANYVSSDTATKNTAWNSITITQTNDSQTLTGSATVAVPLPSLNGDYVDIQCNPSVTNGYTIQTNGSGLFTEPIGVFPVMEPVATTFNIAIASGSSVSAEAVFSWIARYAS